MSSYRGAGSAWDGGPPGAEADYAGAPGYAPAAPPRPMPTTDPWTGVSYSQYGAPPYDYQAYAPPYGYPYDSNFYQRTDGTYYGKYPDNRTYPLQHQTPHASYEMPTRQRDRTDRSRSADKSPRYQRRRSYKSNSRSVSPYERREKAYSKKRDSSYEEGRHCRSRSKTSKHKKYSSSDRSSSRSHSYSQSPQKREKKRRSVSSSSSTSQRSYKKKSNKTHVNKKSTPARDRSSSGSCGKAGPHRTPSAARLSNSSHEGEHKSKESKSHSKKSRKVSTPPRKVKKDVKAHKKAEKSSHTPPPKEHKKYKDKTEATAKKFRESSLTPPKTYRRMLSSSKSRSRSGSRSPSMSPAPRHSKRRRSASRSPRPSRSRSSNSSGSSTPPRRSSKSKRKTKRKSRSKSRSKRRSVSKTRSTSRRRSKSRAKGKHSVSPGGSKSRSRSHSSRSRSRSGSDERRGQFTVADRKRFWKMHRNRQEEKEKEKESKTPPKEVKPPPGAVESTTVDDIEYGDPPEVEGPNFAELLIPDQAMQASSSRVKPGPIPIKNDGSFLEMFKKMQEVTKKAEPEKKPEIKKPALPFIGKRRGGRVLKTGLVKKAKAIDEQTADSAPKDAWSLYMQEVKKYRETSCEEERKTRPLVK
ncbi:serine/arginine-rich splicing factor 4 [Helicoverpa armigera]|uniref:serine/arginine-rich splicing factor 4 n=1 Tax=Helicoverpa armigera TaxID=29058 RepID=UPI003082F983